MTVPVPRRRSRNRTVPTLWRAAILPVLSAAALLAVGSPGAPIPQAAAQNPEMRERICRNLAQYIEEEGLPDRTGEYDRLTGDYDDPGRERSSRDWRVTSICDGRFIWARALYGDVAPFPLRPTEDPNRFTDYRDNVWVFTVDEDGMAKTLEWTWDSGRSFTFNRVE